MSEPARLHPVTIMLTFLKQLKESLIPFLVIFVLGLRDNGLGFPLGIVLTVLFISSLLLNSFLSWYRFTYRLEDGELRIEYGVFIRKKRYIPFERIQSLDYSENIFHQLFGLVKISVETAGSEGKQAEAVLAAVTKKEAEAIQRSFKNIRGPVRPERMRAVSGSKRRNRDLQNVFSRTADHGLHVRESGWSSPR